jgi:hypothetical protein
MNDEIILVENWQWRWCHNVTGMPRMGPPSGTPEEPNPPYVLRYIQLENLRLHQQDGGTMVKKFDTRWESSVSFTKYWDECSICGQKFNETGYE